MLNNHCGAIWLFSSESKGAARGAARAVKVSYKDVKKPILTTKEAIAAKSFFDKPGDDLVVGNAESECFVIFAPLFIPLSSWHFFI